MADFEKFIKSYEPKPMEEYDEQDVDFMINYLNDYNGWDGWRYEKNKNGGYDITTPDDEEPTIYKTLEEAKKSLHEFRNEDPQFEHYFREYLAKKALK